MYTFDEKFKKGAARAFKAQQGLTAFLSGLNRILPEPPGFKTEKLKDKREDTIRIADTAGDSWYLGFSERSITPPDIDAKNYYIGGNLSVPPRRVRGVLDDIKVRALRCSAPLTASGSQTRSFAAYEASLIRSAARTMSDISIFFRPTPTAR